MLIDRKPASPQVIVRYWRISLGIGMIVTGVVAVLLSSLATIVARIDGSAAEIWRVGKLIANNTVHVPLLVQTNQIVANILPAADGIAGATERIQRAVGGTTME